MEHALEDSAILTNDLDVIKKTLVNYPKDLKDIIVWRLNNDYMDDEKLKLYEETKLQQIEEQKTMAKKKCHEQVANFMMNHKSTRISNFY
jgi:hypothetical protein